ncbi:ABC-type dipeptide/oligopeptide/nickel transport system permease component [Bradyrhizobium sp. F1.13.4]
MAAYVLRRIVSTIAVMVVVGIFIFLLLRLSPGDPAAIIAGETATPQTIAGIREQLGLNDPLPVQFFHWTLEILGGNFGASIFTGRPVLQLISQRLEPTISLSVLTISLSMLTGVAFGMLAAWRVGGLVDRTLTAFAALGFSVPVFVVGYFLIYWFAISARWLPVQGYQSIDRGVGSWFVHLILPTMALSFPYIAFIRADHAREHARSSVGRLYANGRCQGRILIFHAFPSRPQECGAPDTHGYRHKFRVFNSRSRYHGNGVQPPWYRSVSRRCNQQS